MRRRPRRGDGGSVAIGILVALVLLQVMLVAGVVASARGHDGTVMRVRSTRAFYAAEAGLSMAMRELMLNADEDGDGSIGSISDDADDDNDPSLGGSSFRVRVETSGTVVTVISEGRDDGVSRELTATLVE